MTEKKKGFSSLWMWFIHSRDCSFVCLPESQYRHYKRFIRPDPAEVQQISTSSGRRLLFVSPFSRCTGILKCSQQDLLLSFETTSPFPLEMTLRNHTGSLGEGHYVSTTFKAGETDFHLCCSYALIYSLCLSGQSLCPQSASSGPRSGWKKLSDVTRSGSSRLY